MWGRMSHVECSLRLVLKAENVQFGFTFVEEFGHHRKKKICISKINDEKMLQASNRNADVVCGECLHNGHTIKHAPSAKIICKWDFTLELGSDGGVWASFELGSTVYMRFFQEHVALWFQSSVFPWNGNNSATTRFSVAAHGMIQNYSSHIFLVCHQDSKASGSFGNCDGGRVRWVTSKLQ